MNISKTEQRVLHVLAQGGAIHVERARNGKIHTVRCFNCDGHLLTACDTALVARLKKRRFIKSVGGHPYRVTQTGLRAVNAQLDNR